MERAGRRLRGMTLLEIMVVGAIGTAVAATATVNIVEQVKRSRAISASRAALHPHASSRDRAVAARTCTETIQVPPLGQAFTPPAENAPPKFPDPAQRDVPRIAVLEWSDCSLDAVINRVDFYDLDGDITLAPYSTGDGRVVFGIDGGVTEARPGPDTGLVFNLPLPCGPGKGGAVLGGGIASEGEGEGEKLPPGPAPACQAPEPTQKSLAVPGDVDFSATTYFGESVDYRIYARVGAVELLTP